MYVTYPMSLGPDEIWIFCEYNETSAVNALRLAINASTGEYMPCPTGHIVTDSLIPVRKDNLEPVGDFVWATVNDLQKNPVFPGWRYTQRPT